MATNLVQSTMYLTADLHANCKYDCTYSVAVAYLLH